MSTSLEITIVVEVSIIKKTYGYSVSVTDCHGNYLVDGYVYSVSEIENLLSPYNIAPKLIPDMIEIE